MRTSWPGRWSLVRTTGILGPPADEAALAELVARQWLERYGIVTRDWWRRERPAIPWRVIYRELKRLEFRGDVRRGYFVRGLAGAQFALPAAVELLRESGARHTDDAEGSTAVQAEPVVVMMASDPANVYSLPLPAQSVEPGGNVSLGMTRGRSRGALLVMRAGEVLLIAERRGKRVTVRPGLDVEQVSEAARALAHRLVATSDRRRDPMVEVIDGVGAAGSTHTPSFVAAGFRPTAGGLRYYAPPV